MFSKFCCARLVLYKHTPGDYPVALMHLSMLSPTFTVFISESCNAVKVASFRNTAHLLGRQKTPVIEASLFSINRHNSRRPKHVCNPLHCSFYVA